MNGERSPIQGPDMDWLLAQLMPAQREAIELLRRGGWTVTVAHSTKGRYMGLELVAPVFPRWSPERYPLAACTEDAQ